MSDDNIIKFGSVQGGKTDEDAIPFNQYVIVDINGDEYYHEGFLLFTSQHVAIMQDRDGSTVPVFMMPLTYLKVCEIVDDEEVAED